MSNQIQSGYFSTPSNTPSGQPKKIAVDNPYLTKDEYILNENAIGLNITANSPLYLSGRLERAILNASAWINRYIGHWMDTQTIDETKTGVIVRPWNPQLVTVVLKNRPYQMINTIYFQVLKWFIQIDTTAASGYLQDFADFGYYRIVPLLSNSGTGTGSPMPAEIVDKVPLGVIWTNYTFGFGTPIVGQALSLTSPSVGKIYQAPLYLRLFAPSQPLQIFDNAVLVDPSNYTVDYPNGIITFISAYTVNGAITANYISNESTPGDVKEACALLVSHMLGQGLNNPLGAKNVSMQTYSIQFGDESNVYERVKQLLEPYIDKMPIIF